MDILKQLPNCKVLSTVKQEEDEAGWLAARSHGIGGSDVGAICGVNKWTSARHIYMRKTGQYTDSEEKESQASLDRMHFGHMLEPVVADEYCIRSGNKVVVSPATLQHKDYPWALANVDRIIVDNEGKPTGILECKTASEYIAEEWEEGNVPVSYLYQLNWYLWITGLEHGVIAALVGGNKFYYYDVYLNEDLIRDEILPKCDKFWNYNVKNLIEPEVDGSEASTRLLNEESPASKVDKKSEIMLVDNEVYNELACTVKECKAKIKELEALSAEASNKLKDKMGLNATAYTKDCVIKWVPREMTRLDTKALKRDLPDVYEKYSTKSSYRMFTVK